MSTSLRTTRTRELGRDPQGLSGKHWSWGGQSKRPSESPTGLQEVREAELINSWYLKGALNTPWEKSPWMSSVGFQVIKLLKQTNFKAKTQGPCGSSLLSHLSPKGCVSLLQVHLNQTVKRTSEIHSQSQSLSLCLSLPTSPSPPPHRHTHSRLALECSFPCSN